MRVKVLVEALQTAVAPYQVLSEQVSRVAQHIPLEVIVALGSFYAIQLKTIVVTAFV
jgi:hypothetical protein